MTKKAILIITAVLLLVAIVLESIKPQPVDWRISYNRKHKKPWGTYVLYHELNRLLPDARIEEVQVTPYEFLSDGQLSGRPRKAYLFINNDIQWDSLSLQKILAFVRNGHVVFISAKHPDKRLSEKLDFRVKRHLVWGKDKKKIGLSLTNKAFGPDKTYYFSKSNDYVYFEQLNPQTSTVLGFVKDKDSSYIHFAKIRYGKGYFLIHLEPKAFTNYYLLKDDYHQYAAHVLSYIRAKKLYWDSRYKFDRGIPDNALRYIMSYPPLKWAWRLGWISILLYILFAAKRRQRIIPVMPQPVNNTVEFVRTIGNMYFKLGKPRDIIRKKIRFFLDDVRRTYNIDTQQPEEVLSRQLHVKTGIKPAELSNLFRYIRTLQNKVEPQEYHLKILNRLINQFYSKTSHYGYTPQKQSPKR